MMSSTLRFDCNLLLVLKSTCCSWMNWNCTILIQSGGLYLNQSPTSKQHTRVKYLHMCQGNAILYAVELSTKNKSKRICRFIIPFCSLPLHSHSVLALHNRRPVVFYIVIIPCIRRPLTKLTECVWHIKGGQFFFRWGSPPLFALSEFRPCHGSTCCGCCCK